MHIRRAALLGILAAACALQVTQIQMLAPIVNGTEMFCNSYKRRSLPVRI